MGEIKRFDNRSCRRIYVGHNVKLVRAVQDRLIELGFEFASSANSTLENTLWIYEPSGCRGIWYRTGNDLAHSYVDMTFKDLFDLDVGLPPKVKEMTVADIEKELGYQVKVVK